MISPAHGRSRAHLARRWGASAALLALVLAARVDAESGAPEPRAPAARPRAPLAVILTPAEGSTYVAGTPIHFSGNGSDADDGALPAAAYQWRVLRRRAGDGQPIGAPAAGITAGSFTPDPHAGDRGTLDPDVVFVVILTVTDSSGLSHTATREVPPQKALVTLATIPAGLPVLLDGVELTTPVRWLGIAGVVRRIEAPARQDREGRLVQWNAWSDGGERVRALPTPSEDTTLTAIYLDSSPPRPPARGGLASVIR